VKFPALSKTAAVSSVLLGLGAAVLTNVITNRWSWTVAVALGVVAAVWAAVEAWRSTLADAPGAGLSVVQKVRVVSGRLVGIRRINGEGRVEQTVDEVAEKGEVVGFEEHQRRDSQLGYVHADRRI
jgi:hypothetical protein